MQIHLHYAANARRGFTLVELMVVIVIISILSALSFAGLAVVRARSKADVTRSTIQKIDGFIVEMYESYFTRNMPYDAGSTTSRATNLGRLMTYEMPDQWQDARITSEVATLRLSGSTSFLASGLVSRYASLIDSLGKRQSPIKTGTAARDFLGVTNSAAECLFACVVQSGFSPNALEDFRPNEVGDTDNDGAKEFLDAFGQPIYFIRWAPGYSDPSGRGGNLSAIQDVPTVVTANVDPTFGTTQAMAPLIYSCGADGSTSTISDTTDFYGLERPKNRTTFSPFEFPDVGKPLLTATPDSPEFNAYRDNITNHDAPRR
jgi:prepilin-type N-terminal cleavage/methylation domain-containing protein